MSSKRQAFLVSAAKANASDCVLWPFAVRKSSGYGAHSISLGRRGHSKNVDAHVYVCTLAHGERPAPDLEAAHSCGHKLCCNPQHLRWATRAENMADAIAAGTLRGGGRYRQRLFAEDIAAIIDSDLSHVELGRRLDIDPAYIGRVRRVARQELSA